LDVQGGVDAENRNIIVAANNGKINQQWDIIYVDEWKGPPKKGEMNPDFGFIVGRKFVLKTALPSGRYLQLMWNTGIHTSEFSIKTPNGYWHQDHMFDQKTLTIINGSSHGHGSWSIKNKGKSNRLEANYTNSKWW
jgi:hypothetical protein